MPTKYFDTRDGHVEIRVTPDQDRPTTEPFQVDMTFPEAVQPRRFTKLIEVLATAHGQTATTQGRVPLPFMRNVLDFQPPTEEEPRRVSFLVDTRHDSPYCIQGDTVSDHLHGVFDVCALFIRYVLRSREL